MVKPETVLRWHRKGFGCFGLRDLAHAVGIEPQCQRTFRNLLRRMSRENPLWGATRIHGELLKLGIQMSEAAVSKYWVRHPKLKSQDWRTFLQKHMGCSASVDFFVAPTATFRLLFVFIVLQHERRRMVHFSVTAHPTSEWTVQQPAVRAQNPFGSIKWKGQATWSGDAGVIPRSCKTSFELVPNLRPGCDMTLSLNHEH